MVVTIMHNHFGNPMLQMKTEIIVIITRMTCRPQISTKDVKVLAMPCNGEIPIKFLDPDYDQNLIVASHTRPTHPKIFIKVCP